MKNYEKPYLEITSYEAEDIITLSGKTNVAGDTDLTGVQKTFKEIQF